MSGEWFFSKLKRKTIVTGHYGSGKTEFAVSIALQVAHLKNRSNSFASLASYARTALIDLDIINPYFRSREKRGLLESKGIAVYGSAYDDEVTLELPALGATVRTPLEDTDCRIIIDLGGNDSGALIINQFSKYFSDNDTTVVAVVNANRPDTSTVQTALEHIKAIENITGLTISGIINNTHMLHETTVADIIKGHEFCTEVCKVSGKELLCNCYPERIIDPTELDALSGNLMPLGLYLRPTWLNKN